MTEEKGALYWAQVQLTIKVDGPWERSVGFPTIILPGDFLGIVSEDHARRLIKSAFESIPGVSAEVHVMREE